MKQFFILLFILGTVNIAFAQHFNLSFKRPLMREIDSIEKANGGKTHIYKALNIKVSQGYFPDGEKYRLGPPITSSRVTTPANTLLGYYYSLPDSTVRMVEYEWNLPEEKSKLLEKIFENNAKLFSTRTGAAGKTTNEDQGDWTQKTTIWENQVIHIKQFIVLGSGTYRVRALLTWK